MSRRRNRKRREKRKERREQRKPQSPPKPRQDIVLDGEVPVLPPLDNVNQGA
jgi:hypothetical protein